MPVRNADIAAIFEEIADLLEIDGANVFRVRAYRNAARILQELGKDVRAMVKKGEDLTELPGIGTDLAAKIKGIVDTGHCKALDELHRRLPPAIAELLKIPGLGPKRVRSLYRELGIQTLDQLRRAVREHRIQALPGFGEKTEMHISDALEAHGGGAGRYTRVVADQFATHLLDYLKRVPGVGRVVIAGSYRRAKETVGDLDILATAEAESPIMQRFVDYEDVAEVVTHGPTRASVLLRGGLQVDFRVVSAENYGAALHYFTGGKAHNIAIRRLGQERGLKINEYGVFRGDERVAGDTEESVFAGVGLPFIPPELREDRGEIEAARTGRLPKLVELADIKGDLHAHTKASDGHNTILEMAGTAKSHGLEYLAITEHSRRLTVAHGLDSVRLLKQMDEIERLNDTLDGIVLLKGIEVDILEDGRLDFPDELLGRLDVVVGAVHSRFDLPRNKQTERILRAMDRPHFNILAHPSGRLIGRREPYDVDMLRVIRKARDRGCFLELNANPERLDLSDVQCKIAKEEGVLVSLNSDGHSTLDFGNLRYAVGQARRGWLESRDVLNSRGLNELRRLLR
ncbi:PHP domain-containing protein [Methylocaldum marinum]|uniref:DNA polymerase beta n=1 Tax=Methylocaldum marinum TaxID=1432792 RepID=A0A250L092_9GAMM|nr:DNA polymerase/3'-5' exonuclease PolX [Methylocaldum marinum]BBA37164.1 PHP domain-containing protein [Methylocaldum marinum]